MTAPLHSLSRMALCALAAVWPLEVYQLLPLSLLLPGEPSWSLSPLLALLLLPGVFLQWRRAGRWPLAWELSWPALALIAVTGAAWALSAGAAAPAAMAALSLMVTVLVPTREDALRLLWLSACAGGIAALLSLAAPWLGLFPAAYSSGAELSLAFAYRLESGALALWLCLVAALAASLGLPGRFYRITAALAALLLGLVLTLLVFHGSALLPHWSTPNFLAAGLPGLLALALGLWLCARVAAKLQDLPGRDTAATVLGWGIVAAVLLALALPAPPHLGHAVPLACAAALALRQARGTAEVLPRLPLYLLLPVLLAALNAWHVPLAPGPDPRNYDARAQQLAAQGRHEALLHEMALVEHFAPGEARAALWRARALLGLGEATAAVDAFTEAFRGRERVLPRPDTELDDFLDRLRDHVSAQPLEARGLAYERAWVAAGEPEQALRVLRLRLPAALPEPREEAATLRAALAGKLGMPEDLPELQAWTAGELQAVLDALP